jgi:ubiquinone/menaquinone biosynthesis C-methylase UbiE
MIRRFWLVPLLAIGAVLLYRRLRPSAASEATKGSWEFSGPMATAYDLLSSLALDSLYKRIARRVIETIPSGKVLDVGCGPGRLAVHLAREAPGLTVTGIDISPDMIALAMQRATATNLTDRLDFQVADVGALPFPDNEFDLVVSTLSLHHWPDPVRGLAEIRRVLKPNGQAYIYDLADWISRLTHHGLPQSTVLAEAPFVREAIGTIWSVGSVPVVTGFRLGREK